MRIVDSFEVDAAVDATWALLMDVPRVVPCMPGATLVETVGDDAWKAQVRVKLGPLSLRFDADVTRSDVDADAHRMVLGATAREARGRGRAQATIASALVPLDGDRTRVELETDVTLAGAIAQYGRGVVDDVASHLVKEFAANLRGQLGAETAAAEGAAPAPPTAPEGAAAPAQPAAAAPAASSLSGGRILWLALRGWLRRTFRRGEPA
ncbi:SRPBCC family protein [Conexibacter woesei]|uniref:Carbon monoxide dehydrogenase subunit G n=1 Tax=Conexibacter woesei (strain DSM 14684 / CCUG 47730 / CIP 108061 / JCM 11494 / NBRC 100937 / ID131577) TaxID=469383 RepID=D3F4R4_CONWI|nr:SRPBCC family protein [Conexibacter woesei]ADB52521.1 carbon monoxide dehydrogenase subunit G [Conexibacter woesei DSM 14684]